MSDKKICQYCGSKNIYISEAKTHELSKDEWIFLIISCLILWLLHDVKGFLGYLVYIDIAILFVWGVGVYREEEEIKNRFKVHCHDCGKDYYFFKNEVESNSPPVNEDDIPEFKEMRQSLEELKKIKENKNKTSEYINLILVLKKILNEKIKDRGTVIDNAIEYATNQRNFIAEIAKKICDDTSSKYTQEWFTSVYDDLNKYRLDEVNKIVADIFPKKYKKSYLTDFEGILKKAGGDYSISKENLSKIYEEYFEIVDMFLKTDLIEYANKKYNISLYYDEKNNQILIEQAKNIQQNSDEIKQDKLKISRNFEKMHKKIFIIANSIFNEKYPDSVEEKLSEIIKTLTDYVRMEAIINITAFILKKYPKEFKECGNNIDKLLSSNLISDEEQNEIVLEFSEINLQVVDNNLAEFISEKFYNVEDENKINEENEKAKKDLYFKYDEFNKELFSKVNDICYIVFDNISFDDFDEKDDPIEIVDFIVKGFFTTKSNMIFDEILLKKYSLKYDKISNNEIKVSMVEVLKDKKISAETAEKILNDFAVVCYKVLYTDLLEFIKQKYNIEIALNNDGVFELVQKEKSISEVAPVRKKSKSNKNVGDDFNSIYQNVVRKIYSNKREVDYLLNYGGLDKLKETLFKNEKIILVLIASESLDSEDSSILKNMLSDDILVLTDKRLLYLQKKLFGTRVFETPRQEFSKIIWEDDKIKFNDLLIYVHESSILKEKIYEIM